MMIDDRPEEGKARGGGSAAPAIIQRAGMHMHLKASIIEI
jgi:hypothetical protein